MTDLASCPPLVGPLPGREPRWPWRGIMIDSARTRFDVDTICRVLDLAARYGFNVLHWHLTDDAGWRFEVPGYPRLTEVGAFLPRSDYGHYTNASREDVATAAAEAPSRWQMGYYSDDDIARVLQHAKARNITVVPEVDLPGHMLAAIAAYPELGRPEGVPLPKWARPNAKPPAAKLPAKNDLLWPTDEAVTFVRAVLDRVMELFDSPIIHIGGDECAFHQWETDPGIDSWLKRRGLSDVTEIQTWFMRIASDHVRSKGRNIAAWDEVCEISDDPDTLVFAWEAEVGLQRALSAPNRFVYADSRWLYLNRIDPSRPTMRGMVPEISLADIIESDWSATTDERCVGIQACVWSEFVLDEADLMACLMPRLLAVAEKIWNPNLEVAEAQERITKEFELMLAPR